MISQFNINVDNYIWFIILLPVIVILSCWIGIWINSLLKILLKKTDNI